MKLGILGCGNWGSVFGILQYRNNHKVSIWEFDRERAERVISTRDNAPFLHGNPIPEEIEVHWDIEKVISGADLVVCALPCQVIPDVIKKLKNYSVRNAYYLSLSKGIHIESLLRPSEIIDQLVAPEHRTYVLSGPCIANEIIRGEPTAVVLVGHDQEGAHLLQHELATDLLRIYQGEDIVGVELGAAIKNVIALGCGMSDGLGFGNNAKGALITRGIVEIQRLGVKMGAQGKTFWGLSGLGDLVTTSFSEESRNHTFGKKIGEGMTVEQIRKEMVMVSEGVPTAQAIMKLAEKHHVSMPICEVVYDILYHKKSCTRAIQELMTRPLKNE
ncbi:MAG: NAD(P)-dependent glycerol-3-phosphate dehydrogenase [candidate division WOR-3 bacterium]|nr:MAG: NAD(P)-dependent glycerol-3-phosphate dehydrogenase [candidate division WOR-3 bacterium]